MDAVPDFWCFGGEVVWPNSSRWSLIQSEQWSIFPASILNLKITEVYIGILTSHEIRIPIHRSGFHGSCHVRVVITAQVKENMASCVNTMWGYLGDGPPVTRWWVTPENYKPCSWPFGRDPITPGLGDSLTDGKPILQSSSQQPIVWEVGPPGREGRDLQGNVRRREGNPFQDLGVLFIFFDLVVWVVLKPGFFCVPSNFLGAKLLRSWRIIPFV